MVKLNNVPRHVAIIPDGNRRWAKLKGKEGSFGHRKAISDKKLKELYICAKKNGVNVLSLWGFSTENWKRLSVEKKVLFEIFEEILLSIRDDPDFSIVRFVHFGRKDRLPDKVVKLLIELEEKTVSNTEFTFCLALDYGGKDEILRACSRLFKSAEEFSEEKFLLNLDTGIKGVSNVDLFISTEVSSLTK